MVIGDGRKPENAQLDFSWKECDGPPGGATPEHYGFGHVVLSKAVPASLDGRASLEFRPEGTAWVLVAPLDQKPSAENSKAGY
jgi:two-component sensor histidine kinase